MSSGDTEIDKAMKRGAFRFVNLFLHSLPKEKRMQSMIIWHEKFAQSRLSECSLEFSRHLFAGEVCLAVVPETEHKEWTEQTIQEYLAHMIKFDTLNFQQAQGTGCMDLKLKPTEEKDDIYNIVFHVKFLKRTERYNNIYLVDNENRALNGKQFCRTKLFAFNFLRPRKPIGTLPEKKLKMTKRKYKKRKLV